MNFNRHFTSYLDLALYFCLLLTYSSTSLEEKKSIIFTLGLQRCPTPDKLSPPTDPKVTHLLKKGIQTNCFFFKSPYYLASFIYCAIFQCHLYIHGTRKFKKSFKILNPVSPNI